MTASAARRTPAPCSRKGGPSWSVSRETTSLWAKSISRSSNTELVMNKLLQFIKRDFQMEIAYKTKFASDLAYIVFPVVLYYFLARMIGDKAMPQMARYGCNYFSFVMVGIATANILQAALQSYTENV